MIRNGALLSSVVWIEAAVAVVYLLAINRALGPADYGAWSYAAACYIIVIALISCGFESVAHFAYGGDRKRGDAVIAAALFWRIALGAGACIAFAVYFAFRPPFDDSGWNAVLWVIAPAILGRSLANLARATLVGRSAVARAAPISLALRGAEAVGAVALLAFGAPLVALAVLHASSWLAEGYLLLKRVAVSDRPILSRPDWRLTRDIARSGAPRAVIQGLLAVMVGAPLILFEPRATAADQVGYLAIAFQTITIAVLTGQTFINASSPSLAKHANAAGRVHWRYAALVGAASLSLFALLAAMFQTTGEAIFIVAFGETFADLAPLAVFACVLGALQLAPNGLQQSLLATERYAPGVIANLLGCAALFAGFHLTSGALTPIDAIWIISAAWAVRLIAMAVTARLTPSS